MFTFGSLSCFEWSLGFFMLILQIVLLFITHRFTFTTGKRAAALPISR